MTEKIEVTIPPCEACHAHDELSNRVNNIARDVHILKKNVQDTKELNTLEHEKITKDVVWMKMIGKWMLGGVGAAIILIYSINTKTADMAKDIEYISKTIKSALEDIEVLKFKHKEKE